MKTILIGLCTLALSAGVSGAESAASPAGRAIVAARSSAEDAADSLYRLGRQAINDDNYERAISIFRQVVDKCFRKKRDLFGAERLNKWHQCAAKSRALFPDAGQQILEKHFELGLGRVDFVPGHFPPAGPCKVERETCFPRARPPADNRGIT